MAISGYTKDEFIKMLNLHVSASGPVRTIERLFGREKELSLIEEALYAEGRHIFIFGDRGVGKSSLAASAAAQYQSSDSEPIQIGCGPDTTFYRTIEDLAERVIKKSNGKRNYAVTQTVKVKFYTIKWNNINEEVAIPNVDSMYTAVEAIEDVSKYHSATPVVVIDEFDQIESDEERKLFANFLKVLGDRGVNIKFVFTGVAASLFKLLGDHESSFRQLHTIELQRLNWSAREAIVNDAIHAFGLAIDPKIVYGIAKISNGFPYYVHLITEKLLWSAFHDESVVDEINNDHFINAIEDAILSINAQLQRPYDLATQHRTNDYREILWATADSESMIRYTDGMFKSYLRIHQQLYGSNPDPDSRPLPRDKFMTRVLNLKKQNYGNIIENPSERRGLYSYRENILRGFVAMKALEAGIELQGDVPDEPKVPTVIGKEKRRYSARKDWAPHVKFRGEK